MNEVLCPLLFIPQVQFRVPSSALLELPDLVLPFLQHNLHPGEITMFLQEVPKLLSLAICIIPYI